MAESNDNSKIFVKDNFFVDGTISCKFIFSLFSEEYKKKVQSDKLKFELSNDPINDKIINQLQNKEMFFLKKIFEMGEQIKYPIKVKSFLKSEEIINISNISKFKESEIVIKKTFDNKKEETSMILTDVVKNIALKIKFDMNEKTIKSNNKTKISMNDLIEIVKSENIKLNVRIQCNAVFSDGILHIGATLTKINVGDSPIIEIYQEFKEINKLTKLTKSTKFNGKNKTNSIDKLSISQYPTKSSTITNNIMKILSEKNK